MLRMFQGASLGARLSIFVLYGLLTVFCSNSAYAGHVTTIEKDNTVYILYSAPNRLARFDLANGTALDDIILDKVPTAFAVENNVAYLGFNRELVAIDLDSGATEFLRNFSSSITGVGVIDNFIYVKEQSSDLFHIIDATSSELVGVIDTFYSGPTFITSDELNALFFRDSGISPSDIHKATLNESGTADSTSETPYHGDHPTGTKLYLNSTQTKLVENSGIAYYTSDLTYAGSLGGSFETMTFVDDNPVIARAGQLELFNSAFLSLGTIAIDQTPQYLAHFENTITAFLIDDSDYSYQSFDISAFALPEPGEPADPNDTPYTPEFIETDEADLIYFVDEQTQSIFRWSISQGKYLESWWLGNAPAWVSYSKSHSRLYVGQKDGRITYFDASLSSATETHFVTLVTPPTGLLAVGDLLFAADSSGAWGTHYLLNMEGEITDQAEWRHAATEYVFNPTLSKIYHYRPGISPNDIEWSEFDPTTGLWTANGDSPYHGGQLQSRSPLRIIDNDNYLLNGAGQLLDTHSLTILNNLSTGISDASWVNEQLVTVSPSGTQLQFWSDRFQLINTYDLEGSSRTRLFAANDLLTLVKQTALRPEIISLDLNNLPDSDADGVHDLLDNCINVPNTDQVDFDQDGIGDSCDPDSDNDQINDELEVALGLDPRDPTDADLDLDGDGYSNRIEAILGSALDDAQDIPAVLEHYVESFESGIGLLNLGQAANRWSLYQEGFSGKGLRSGDTSNTQPPSEVELTALFNESQLNFRFKFVGEYYFLRNIEVLVDGEVVTNASGDSYWNSLSVPVSPGLHTITIRAKPTDGFTISENGFFVIDDLTVGRDSDQDGVLDPVDNCPTAYNWDQSDSDADGIGDACDPNPLDPNDQVDTDGDGIIDYFDNCPENPNPNQEDVDGDGIGDLCDDFDNRPQDADGDGLTDGYDNCPLVANSDQADLDFDGQGDACDDDIDGDGLTNDIEAQYDFLDPFNPADADMDHDNDGVSNLYEINTGTDPAEANEFPYFDLTNYLPLKAGEYAYVNELHFVTREIRKLDTREETVVIIGNSRTERYEERTDGIYLVSQSDSSNLEGSRYGDFLYLPKQLKLGQKVTSLVSRTDSSPWHTAGDFEVSLQLVAFGNVKVSGQTHHTVVIRYDYEFPGVGFGYSEEVTFAEGLGWYNYHDLLLDSFTFEQEPSTPNEEDPNEQPGDTESPGKKSSGGAFPLSGLILMLMMVAQRRFAKTA